MKRGDIGSTSQAYADAYLDPRSPLFCDAVTASPYLGFGSLDPLLAQARAHNAGVFVLALTSNPEAPSVQHARTADGHSVAGGVLTALTEANAGAEPMGSFGAVVGATIGETGEDLDVNGPLLVPGVGAQGGTPATVRRIFSGVLPQRAPRQLAGDPRRRTLRGRAARRGRADRAVVRGAAGRASVRRPAAAVLTLALAATLCGCGDQQEKYCDALRQDRTRIDEIINATGGAALLAGLPVFRDLADEAPDDLTDEWQTFVNALEGLQDALHDAGVKPSEFRHGKIPASVTGDDAAVDRGRGRHPQLGPGGQRRVRHRDPGA